MLYLGDQYQSDTLFININYLNNIKRMAKKDPTDLTVEEKLKTLYQLQTTLSAIDEKRALRGELPLEVQDLEDEIAGLATRIENIERDIDQFQRAVSQKQGDLKHAQEMKADRERGLVEKRAELDDIMEETREEEDRLKEKAIDLEKKIESRLLSSFKRIRKGARNGLGIVYVQRDACGGCFNKIPPQRQLDIKMHKKIIPCEYCGRILIDPELAGVKIETPAAEEKPKRKRTIRKKKAEDAE